MGLKYREFKFYSNADKLEIHAMVVAPETKPVGIVQLVHGMCEYKERYYDFMKYLAKQGYFCVIHDHRGHGKSVISDADLGYMFDAGYEGLIEDTYQVMELVKDYVREDIPYILLGHSMGSMVVRSVLKRYDDEIDKVVILGSPSKQKGLKAVLALIKAVGKIKGFRNHSKLLDFLVMNNSFERRFKKEKLQHAWLTSDRELVEAYNADRYCNFTFTINGYRELIRLMQDAYGKEDWRMRNKEIPIRFFSGKDDPCCISPGDFGASIHFLKERGYKNVHGVLYKGMRHEILNEKYKKRVYKDIYDFIRE